MQRSFYHYLMTLRSPKNDAISLFAGEVFLDAAFPKQAEDYETLSHYLEFSVDYLPNMDIFDEVYGLYQENNS